MSAEIGYIVSDLVVTGPERGAYKVWIPKKHGDPTGKSSYTGFGSNLGNLGSAELSSIQAVAEYCFPAMPLSSGGHMPFDPASGLTSTTEKNDNITADTVTMLQPNGQFSAVNSKRNYSGSGVSYLPRQASGANAMSSVYTTATSSGTSVNIHQDTPIGNYVRLSIGTKVAVSGNIIIGQLLQTNNDLINQFRPLNQL